MRFRINRIKLPPLYLPQENDKLREMLHKSLESKGVYVPPLDMSREVHHRLRNLEEFCHKLSEREIDRLGGFDILRKPRWRRGIKLLVLELF